MGQASVKEIGNQVSRGVKAGKDSIVGVDYLEWVVYPSVTAAIVGAVLALMVILYIRIPITGSSTSILCTQDETSVDRTVERLAVRPERKVLGPKKKEPNKKKWNNRWNLPIFYIGVPLISAAILGVIVAFIGYRIGFIVANPKLATFIGASNYMFR